MKQSVRIENRKARHDFVILETIEGGLALKGPEVKSIRSGSANLRDSFARFENGQLYIYNFHIAQYPSALEKPDPERKKKVLLHRNQLLRWERKVAEKGLTIVPLSVYFNRRGRAKVDLALAKGKKQYDRRQAIKERETRRQIERKMKNRGAK